MLGEAVGGRSKVEDEHRSGAQGGLMSRGVASWQAQPRAQPQKPAPSINTLGPWSSLSPSHTPLDISSSGFGHHLCGMAPCLQLGPLLGIPAPHIPLS